MLTDGAGFSIPLADHDAIAESEALCNGPPCSPDPTEWPDWCDDWRFKPSPDDEAWWVAQNADDDWQTDAAD
jgi:hypothetical protein